MWPSLSFTIRLALRTSMRQVPGKVSLLTQALGSIWLTCQLHFEHLILLEHSGRISFCTRLRLGDIRIGFAPVELTVVAPWPLQIIHRETKTPHKKCHHDEMNAIHFFSQMNNPNLQNSKSTKALNCCNLVSGQLPSWYVGEIGLTTARHCGLQCGCGKS